MLASVTLALGLVLGPALRPGHAAPRTTVAVMDGAPSLREQMMAYIKSVQERGIELTEEQKAMIAEFEDDDELLDQTGMVDYMKGAEIMTKEEFLKQQAESGTADALKRSRTAADLQARYFGLDGDDDDGPGIELDPTTGLPVAQAVSNPTGEIQYAAGSPSYGDPGYGQGMGRRPGDRGMPPRQTLPPPPPDPLAPPVPPPAPPPAPPPVAVSAPPPVAAPAAVDAGPIDAATARLWMMQAAERQSAATLMAKRLADGSLSAADSAELRRALASLVCTLAA